MPVDSWYSEESYYDYSNPGFSQQTGTCIIHVLFASLLNTLNPISNIYIYVYIYRSLHTPYYTWYVLVILGHFTQVVWKSSQRLGIAKAKSSSGWTYVCASYDPPGNYAGQFTANVPPPLSFQMVKGSPIAISNASKLEFP